MKKILILISLIAISSASYSQEELSIFRLYDLAIENHPLSNLDSLYNIQEDYNVSAIKKNYMPELNLSGQISYQSVVPEIVIPVPGLTMPEFPKDHYNFNLDVNQIIYDGGITKTLQEIEKLKTLNLKELTNKDIYQLYDNINQAYFGILLIDANIDIINSIYNDINSKLENISQAIKNDLATENDFDKLYTEKLKLEEKIIDLNYNRDVLINTISELTGLNKDILVNFSNPIIQWSSSQDYDRPEHKLLDLQGNIFDQKAQMLDKNRLPKVSGFAQAGYGKPGYNYFADDFSDYYMIGVRFKWNIYDWGETNLKKKSLFVEKEIINNKRLSLNRQLNIAIIKLESEIKKLEEQKDRASQIVSLKEKILERSDTALQNGVMVISDYLYDVNELARAKQQLQNYNILKSQAILNKMIITGEIQSLRNNNSSIK